MMKKVISVVASIVLLCLGNFAWADVFNLGNGYTNLETVVVGDAGNKPDTTGFGAVDHIYSIGKYEVTAAQYTDFLNHKAKSDPYGLWDPMMENYNGSQIIRSGSSGNYSYSVASDWSNRPVGYVNFWDACRFVNWLNNGQGDSDIEYGAYILNGYNGNTGNEITRNPNARWFLPSEDEWYKAAYYKGNGTAAGYWDYSTQSDLCPESTILDPDPGNNANIANGYFSLGAPYWTSVVGEFENSESAYGTFDQTGNVWEWNETTVYDHRRGLRGGAFGTSSLGLLSAHYREPIGQPLVDYDTGAGGVYTGFGFRVATKIIPEPSSLLTLCGGVAGLLAFRRRRL